LGRDIRVVVTVSSSLATALESGDERGECAALRDMSNTGSSIDGVGREPLESEVIIARPRCLVVAGYWAGKLEW